MPLPEDLVFIERAATRAINVIRAAMQAQIVLLPSDDLEGETGVTLTPAQRQAVMDRLAPLLAAIKARTTNPGWPP